MLRPRTQNPHAGEATRRGAGFRRCEAAVRVRPIPIPEGQVLAAGGNLPGLGRVTSAAEQRAVSVSATRPRRAEGTARRASGGVRRFVRQAGLGDLDVGGVGVVPDVMTAVAG